jgi:parvulin-like peptidyl-prolyl isomerase
LKLAMHGCGSLALAVACCAMSAAQDLPGGYPTTGVPGPSIGGPPSGLPEAPVLPEAVSRPDNWPGGSDDPSAVFAPPLGAYEAPVGANVIPYDPNKSLMLESAQVLANVNSEVILYSEVAGFVNDVLTNHGDQIPPEQLEKQRQLLTVMRMRQLVETKLLYADAKRTIMDRNAEAWQKFQEAAAKDFEVNETKRLYKRAKVKSRAELEAKFNAMGTSVEREKRAYIERVIASQWLGQQTESKDAELPPQELWKYYSDHIKDYSFPAQVRWEHLMTKPERYQETDAKRRLCELGNQIINGAPFAEVARQHSNGPDKSTGGQHDWTTLDDIAVKDTHVSTPMRQALESLPVGALSQIIEDGEGFHIVRVLERKPAGTTPFEQVVAEIKKKLQNEVGNKKMDEYMAKLQRNATVRTAFDNTEIMQMVMEQEAKQKQR